MKKCDVCDGKYFSNINGVNYCQKHYWQITKHGYITPSKVRSLENEIWKPVNFINQDGTVWDLQNKYEISNKGRIKILNFRGKGEERLIKIKTNKNGYCSAQLFDEKNNKLNIQLHRLVAYHFIENPDNKPFVDHIIPISTGGTNEATNLRWVTQLENVNNKLSIENYKQGAKERGKKQLGKSFSEERKNNIRNGIVNSSGTKIVALNVNTQEIITFDCEKDVMKYFNTTAKFSKIWCDKNKIRKGWKFYFYDTYMNLKGENN